MRIGIFGGSFDPVHLGHLLLAESCREQCELEQVWFLPAAVPPHKTGKQLAPAKDRVEMLQLATAGHAEFRVSTVELKRGGVSYTADTLHELHQQLRDSQLFFLMGADSLRDLPDWHEPRRICALAVPIVVARAGAPEPDWEALRPLVDEARWEQIRGCQVTMPQVDISSTDIRARTASGRSIRFRTPRAVERYIETHQLYRLARSETTSDAT